MLIPSVIFNDATVNPSLSRRVNANSQLQRDAVQGHVKLIKKGEC
ncbi:hypothetical protein MCC10074_1662 [Bifidobacterium longum subsp. longum]|nr:hypothetical protein MCC10074_1662 [Bifidobacterium longum subsp. longum]